MRREEAYGNVYRWPLDGQLNQGWNVLGENENIASLTMEGNLNYQGINLFPTTVHTAEVANSMLYAQRMGYSPKSNFASQTSFSHRQTDANCQFEGEVFPSSFVNKDDETGFAIPSGRNYFSNEVGIGMRPTKRKVHDDYNSYIPMPKQHITEERMAAGMNKLYITNDHNYCNMQEYNPENRLQMEFNAEEMVPQDDLSSSEERAEENHDEEQDDGKARRDYPVFQFSAPLEQFLKRKSEILPPKILDEICRPCLALVPWTPPPTGDGDLQKEKCDIKVDKNSLTQAVETEDEATLNRCSLAGIDLPNAIDDEDICDEMEL